MITTTVISWFLTFAPLQGNWEVVAHQFQIGQLNKTSVSKDRVMLYRVRWNEMTMEDPFGNPVTYFYQIRPKALYWEIDLFLDFSAPPTMRGIFLQIDNTIVIACQNGCDKPRPTTFQVPLAGDGRHLIVLKQKYDK